MSYVAISFPVAGQSITKKQESLKRAQKFAKEIGLDNSDISVIREGVYGCIVSDDIDDAVLGVAKKHNAKILPFVEADTSDVNVNEGQWLVLESATAGIRFEMAGTNPSNPVEGKILPGKYFVLGLQESNGGQHATLGRVDRLADLGKGNGKYVYNVDISLLKAAMATSAKTESQKATKKAEKKEKNESAHIRSDVILDMLLENDPYILAENKKNGVKEQEKALEETEKKDSPTGEPTLEELIQEAVNLSPETKDDSSKNLTESAENTEIAEENATETEVSEEEEDGEFDPEVYAESRKVIAALEEAGIDIDSLTEDELDEALATLFGESEDESEASSKETAEDTKEETTEAPDASEKPEETKEESTDDDAFEVAPAKED